MVRGASGGLVEAVSEGEPGQEAARWAEGKPPLPLPSLGQATGGWLDGHHVDVTYLHMRWAVVTRVQTHMYTMPGVNWGLRTGSSSSRDKRYQGVNGALTDRQTVHETRPPCSHLTVGGVQGRDTPIPMRVCVCVCICPHMCETWHQQSPHGERD